MSEWRVSIHKTAAIPLALLLCFGATGAFADEPMSMGFVEAGRAVLGLYWAAPGGFAVADLDGDGVDDVAFTGTNGSTSLFVVGQLANKSIGFKQVVAFSAAGGLARVVSATVGGFQHLFVVGADGTVVDYSGWPLKQVSSFHIAPANVAVAGPLYGDADALVTLTADHVYAYALDTGEQLWSYEFIGGVALALAQLDADPALEVIISADASRVIDGATQATDWQYSGAFGYSLATGHLAGDETTQFLGSSGPEFTVFGSYPWQPLWSASAGAYPSGVGALATADLDHNHHDVVLEGDSQSGVVHAYDSTTHQLRFTINYSYSGVTAIAAPDVDGDGIHNIVFASAVSYAQPSVEVVDSSTGEFKWSFESQDGVFSPIAYGDVDGDGKQDLVVANYSVLSYADPSRVEVFDAATGELKWQSPASGLNTADPYYIVVRKIVLRPHAHDAAMDIILAGHSSYDGKVVWIDGATHAVKFQVYTYGYGGPLVDRYVIDAALVDYDNDGTADLVVATVGPFGAGDGRLTVFSGIDGHTLWTSPPITGAPSIKNVLVTGSPADESGQLVAVLEDGLVGYNIKDPALTWSLLAALDGAVYIPDGVDGAEFAVFLQGGAVTFYAAADRTYLRAFTLPAPLNALTSLDGTPRNLLAASSETLTYADGTLGSLLARTPSLGSNLGQGNQLAATLAAPSAWRVAAGNNFGVYQYRLEMTFDRLFESGFDSN